MSNTISAAATTISAAAPAMTVAQAAAALYWVIDECSGPHFVGTLPECAAFLAEIPWHNGYTMLSPTAGKIVEGFTARGNATAILEKIEEIPAFSTIPARYWVTDKRDNLKVSGTLAQCHAWLAEYAYLSGLRLYPDPAS